MSAEWTVYRKQRLQLYEHKTGWKDVRSGELQGSFLGLLLFTIFIDERDGEVRCEISKFANDTKIAS